jgi:hypothetical protein
VCAQCRLPGRPTARWPRRAAPRDPPLDPAMPAPPAPRGPGAGGRCASRCPWRLTRSKFSVLTSRCGFTTRQNNRPTQNGFCTEYGPARPVTVLQTRTQSDSESDGPRRWPRQLGPSESPMADSEAHSPCPFDSAAPRAQHDLGHGPFTSKPDPSRGRGPPAARSPPGRAPSLGRAGIFGGGGGHGNSDPARLRRGPPPGGLGDGPQIIFSRSLAGRPAGRPARRRA